MSEPFDRSSGTDDYVDMHHRLRRSIRMRLKMASAKLEIPVTDMVNEAIEAWLEENELGSHLADMPGDVRERVGWLKHQKAAGNFFASTSSMPKEAIIKLLNYLGLEVDRRNGLSRCLR